MAVANTLAYYITATISAVKSFIAQDPGACPRTYIGSFLLANIRLNWRGLPGSNALAY